MPDKCMRQFVITQNTFVCVRTHVVVGQSVLTPHCPTSLPIKMASPAPDQVNKLT
jgi:hypothetical protein